MKQTGLKLYDYHVWANNKFFVCLKELPEEVYEQNIQSVFPSIAEALAHIYIVDTVWLGIMRGKEFEEVKESSLKAVEEVKGKSIEEMEQLFKTVSKQYKEFFKSEHDLDKPVAPVHPHFGRLETSITELIQHVVNHGTYHRGNIAAMIRQLGHKGVSTDYIFYLYEENGKK
ncbi:DinB family protein [Mesobacillus zeae]|uniref:Damage-inducible protein DinB n=1 Tax=Mesobacillus zeae TaxID=1917180 RepID=A0A398AV06_9BACI|nr:DinB family protein [Mesobacillus zeae]RID81481.1 damage-inducible protein DinB [Mesobacillus zeae]